MFPVRRVFTRIGRGKNSGILLTANHAKEHDTCSFLLLMHEKEMIHVLFGEQLFFMVNRGLEIGSARVHQRNARVHQRAHQRIKINRAG